MYRKICLMLVCSFLLSWNIGEANAQQKPEPAFSFPVSHYRLKNGLGVILTEDYTLPLVSIAVTYKVGSIHEGPGKRGLAYLLENMMFLGSENVSLMQHVSLIHRIGGGFNAITSEDKTLFSQTVPSNQVAQVLWLESDRMRSLDITAANVERAKDMIIEELGQRKRAEPYLETFHRFDEYLYHDPAFSHPVLGDENDIRNLTLEDVKSFYSIFYVPSNAVICISGHFQKNRIKELVAKYFETIPGGKSPPPLPSPLPPEKREIIDSVQNSRVPYFAFHLDYRIAAPQSSDFYALAIIDYILIHGQSARLIKRLLKRERLAFYLSGGIEERGGLATFKLFAMNNNETTIDLSQKAIFAEINKLKTSFISEKELQKAKNLFKLDYLNRLSTVSDKAIFLSEAYFALPNFDEFPEELNKYLRVTPQDIVAMVNRYFIPENRVILRVKMR
jgi:predicted Zn-dependent peptidase